MTKITSLKKIAIILLVLITFSNRHAWALDWESFVPAALQKSPDVQQTRLLYEVTELPLNRANAQLDWNMTVEVGQERDRTLTLTNQTFDLEESLMKTATVKKSFLTGTDMSLSLISEDYKSTSNFLTTPRDDTFESYVLSIEQNLWRNAFGQQLRSQVNAAKAEAEGITLRRYEEIEASILKGANLFWSAAVEERRYKESEAALERYKGLVRNIEGKSRNRYAAPGELAQVRAQFYSRERLVRLNKINFEQAMINLKVYLPEMKRADLKWSEKFPDFEIAKQGPQFDVTKTRAFQMAELRQKQLDLQAEGIESQNKAQVALVGRVGATGVDETASRARRQVVEGDRPEWYVGLKWSHTFGSGVHEAETRQAAAQARAQEIATQSEKERLSLLKYQLEGAIASLQANLKTQSEQLEAQRQAVQQLTRTYNQGRTDISILIDTINRAEDAEVEQVQTRADLEVAYLQWQFLFDKIKLN